MKFVITKTSSDKPYETIKSFETIDQLMKFRKQVKNDLIITANFVYLCIRICIIILDINIIVR